MARQSVVKPASGRKPEDKALRLHGAIAKEIGGLIVSGRFKAGHVLDGEIEASVQREVSRSAYREALRILAAKGLVNSRPRVGTRVSPQNEWHLLDTDVLTWIFDDEPDAPMLHSLFEFRLMVEPQAAALAAANRAQRHLDTMQTALTAMKKHTLNNPAGRLADQEFHAALLSATGNPFVQSLANSVAAAVEALSAFKQRNNPLARDPVPDHEAVFDAISEKDTEKAREAMSRLIRLAILDTPIRKRGKNK